jgi:hypothetical protein
MAEEIHNCDITQGFNFKRDVQNPLGHIKSLTIGDTEIPANMDVINPENDEIITVVGVIGYIEWEGGDAHPIRLSCQVSNTNKVLLAGLTGDTLHNTSVELDFDVFQYDPAPEQRKFYKCFHCNDEAVKGLIEKSGGKLNISIEQEHSHEVMSPLNFTLSLGVLPEEIEQHLQIAHAVGANKTSRWGVPTTH